MSSRSGVPVARVHGAWRIGTRRVASAMSTSRAAAGYKYAPHRRCGAQRGAKKARECACSLRRARPVAGRSGREWGGARARRCRHGPESPPHAPLPKQTATTPLSIARHGANSAFSGPRGPPGGRATAGIADRRSRDLRCERGIAVEPHRGNSAEPRWGKKDRRAQRPPTGVARTLAALGRGQTPPGMDSSRAGVRPKKRQRPGSDARAPKDKRPGAAGLCRHCPGPGQGPERVQGEGPRRRWRVQLQEGCSREGGRRRTRGKRRRRRRRRPRGGVWCGRGGGRAERGRERRRGRQRRRGGQGGGRAGAQDVCGAGRLRAAAGGVRCAGLEARVCGAARGHSPGAVGP